MPLRTYKCSCGIVWDELISGNPPATMKCEKCGRKGKFTFSYSLLTEKNRMKNYRVDFKPGYDLGAGRVFNTKMERENWLSEKGYRQDKTTSGSKIN